MAWLWEAVAVVLCCCGLRIKWLEEEKKKAVARAEAAEEVADAERSDALAEARQARKEATEARQEKAAVEKAAISTSMEYRRHLQHLRNTSGPNAFCRIRDDSLPLLIRTLLLRLSHERESFRGRLSRCRAFQNMQVVGVESLQNPRLWQRYGEAKAALRGKHQSAKIRSKPLDPPFVGLEPLFPDGVKPDKALNEVLLLHGCKRAAAESIVKDGFDLSQVGSNGSLYGRGLYFAQEPCKASQYTGYDIRHLVVVRVTLGDCAYVCEAYDGDSPPVRKDGRACADAIVVNPENSRLDQHHREFVIFDVARAYPELLISYKLP